MYFLERQTHRVLGFLHCKIAIEKFDNNNKRIGLWEFEVVMQENQNTVEDFVVND